MNQNLGETRAGINVQPLLEMDEILGQVIQNNGDLMTSLKENIVRVASALHPDAAFTLNLMNRVTTDENYRNMLTNAFKMFEFIVQGSIERGQQRHIVRCDIPSEEIAQDMINLYLGCMVRWVLYNGDEPIERIMNDSLSHYLKGVAPPA